MMERMLQKKGMEIIKVIISGQKKIGKETPSPNTKNELISTPTPFLTSFLIPSFPFILHILLYILRPFYNNV